jgi:ATP-dependent RNA helicase MRH4
VRSKVLVFCNKSTKVEELGKYLQDKGIPNVAITSTSNARKRGSNHHLDGFLRQSQKGSDGHALTSHSPRKAKADDTTSHGPNVMITTSLLSRGLDFSPEIKHVFIVDEPRNMIDFLHRAGRSGRAGQKGKVIVFGKLKGRGSDKAREVRKKVVSLGA